MDLLRKFSNEVGSFSKLFLKKLKKIKSKKIPRGLKTPTGEKNYEVFKEFLFLKTKIKIIGYPISALA